MGQYNSSLHRVRPVFDYLRGRDKSGRTWLSPLLRLPGRPDRPPLKVGPEQLGTLEQAAWKSEVPAEAGWSPMERPLRAPDELLLYLVDHIREPERPGDWGDGVVGEKRRLLADGNPAMIEEARDLLNRKPGSPDHRRWAVLEGTTYPDVYLQTPTTIIVIEGKFTESHPTTRTTWMPIRSQMLRHIDAARDGRSDRNIYGFFIAEDETAPGWRDVSKETVSTKMLDGSLPHRDLPTRAAIANAFLGLTTWKTVCDTLKIPGDRIKSRVQIAAEVRKV